MIKNPWRKKWFCKNFELCKTAQTGDELTVDSHLFNPACKECGKELELVAKPFPWLVAIPVAIILLVIAGYLLWPPAPLAIKITPEEPVAAGQQPGKSAVWRVDVTGGRSSTRFQLSAASLSPDLVPTNGVLLEPIDQKHRTFKLTAGSLPGESGHAKIGLAVNVGTKVVSSTNVAFVVGAVQPPVIAAQSPVPPALTADTNNMVLEFEVSDSQVAASNLNVTAATTPPQMVAVDIQSVGAIRQLTLSRLAGASGLVQLNIHVSTPDGRETNLTCNINIEPLAPPIQAVIPPPAPVAPPQSIPPVQINSLATDPADGNVQSGANVVWRFGVDGGLATTKPVVSFVSLSPESLPAAGFKLDSLDDAARLYQLTAQAGQPGSGQVKVVAQVGDLTGETVLTVNVASKPLDPWLQQVKDTLVLEHNATEAYAMIQAVIQTYPRSAKAWSTKAMILHQMGQIAATIEACEKALTIDAQDSLAVFIEGTCYERQGNFSQAKKYYNRWLELTPGADPRKSKVLALIQNWTQEGY